jgi:pyruvate kinase
VENGDLVVITAGVPVGITGTTNLLKVHTVAEILVRGTAIGRKAATGRARIVLSERDAARVQEGEILIASVTDAEFVPAMERAAAIVTEEGGVTSHGAVAGLSLGKPVIVGAEGATTRINDGMLITVDAIHGLVYRGKATVK